ncbi:LytR C-terminal domain-containing protein [Gordonia sp. VNK21]|uniref:LytR C-terminal domain-containing protein n=1 Tax=Gordonia sp. VNK21 TaxID=3382483 RepID=UPI0038D4779E
MKADREPNRLPLRAGAMLLLAVAVLFLALGIHSATKDDDPAKELEQAGQSAQLTETTSAGNGGGGTAGESTSPSKTTSADAADVPELCVLNAGTVTGLAKTVSDDLESAGFSIGTDPGNLSTSSVTENTVFYNEGEQSAGEKVAQAVPGGASAEARPAAFSNCPGEIAVVVVTGESS